jgi:hypothetical protein
MNDIILIPTKVRNSNVSFHKYIIIGANTSLSQHYCKYKN